MGRARAPALECHGRGEGARWAPPRPRPAPGRGPALPHPASAGSWGLPGPGPATASSRGAPTAPHRIARTPFLARERLERIPTSSASPTLEGGRARGPGLSDLGFILLGNSGPCLGEGEVAASSFPVMDISLPSWDSLANNGEMLHWLSLRPESNNRLQAAPSPFIFF